MSYKPLPCAIRDHLELACITGTRLRICLTDQTLLEFTPRTTEVRTCESAGDKAEWLVGDGYDVRLDRIAWFEPAETDGRFERQVI